MLQRLGGFLLEYPRRSTWNKTPTWLISRLRMQPTRTAPHRTALHLTAARPCQEPKPNQTKPNPPAHSHSPQLPPSPYYFSGQATTRPLPRWTSRICPFLHLLRRHCFTLLPSPSAPQSKAEQAHSIA